MKILSLRSSTFLLLLFTLVFTLAFLSVGNATAQTANSSEAPPCTTVTCIDPLTIAIAQHAQVMFDPMPVFFESLAAPEAGKFGCATPQPTNVTVFKQVEGRIEDFPDTLCLNQGCAPNRGNDCQ